MSGRNYVKIEDRKIKGRMSKEEIIKFIKENKNLANTEKVEKLNQQGKLTQRAKPFTKENLQQFINEENLGKYSPVSQKVIRKEDTRKTAREILDKFPKGSKVFQGDIIKQTGINRKTLAEIIKREYPSLKTIGREEFIAQRTKEGYESGKYSTDTESQRSVKFNKKRREIINDISNYNFEDKIRKFKKGAPLDQAHRLSIEQSRKLNNLYNVSNLGLDNIKTNRETIKPFENALKKQYTIQNNLVKQAKKFDRVPVDLQNKLSEVNKNISDIVALSEGRLQGIHVDEKTLQPKVTGVDFSKSADFGVIDKPVKKLTSTDFGIIQENLKNNLSKIKTQETEDFLTEKLRNDPNFTKTALQKYNVCMKKSVGGDFASCVAENIIKDADLIKNGNATQKMVASNRFKDILRKGAAAGKGTLKSAQTGLATLGLPLELGLEGLLVGWDMAFNAKPLDEAINANTIVVSGLVEALPDGQLKESLGGGLISGPSAERLAIQKAIKGNDAAERYDTAQEALDKYNGLKTLVKNYSTSPQAIEQGLYDEAVQDLKDYEYELNFLGDLDQFKKILTPGSYESNEYKRSLVAQKSERLDETYGDQKSQEELLQPYEGAFDPADLQKDRAEEFKSNVEDIYGGDMTQEEFAKLNTPNYTKLIAQQLGAPNYKDVKPGMYPKLDSIVAETINQAYPKSLELFEGIKRQNYSEGGRGITRRGFLRVIGGIGALVGLAKTGMLKLTTTLGKQTLNNAPKGTPDWFAPLVDKIAKEGIDITDAAATVDGQIVKELKTPNGDSYVMSNNTNTGEITIDVDAPEIGVNGDPVSFNMKPERIDDVTDTGQPMVEEGEFFVAESRAENLGTFSNPNNIELTEQLTDLDNSASNWHAVEEFATGKTNKVDEAKKLKVKKALEDNPLLDIPDTYYD